MYLTINDKLFTLYDNESEVYYGDEGTNQGGYNNCKDSGSRFLGWKCTCHSVIDRNRCRA